MPELQKSTSMAERERERDQTTLLSVMEEDDFQGFKMPPKLSSPKMLYPLLLVILLSAIIISINISNPYLVLTTHEEIHLPPSVHSHISHIQAQVGSLLEQLHSQAPDSINFAHLADRVLRIAVSLDKLAHDLSHSQHYSGAPMNRNSPSSIEGDDDSVASEENEANTGLSGRGIFDSEEARNYTTPKPHRHGLKNFLGVDAVRPSVGLACAAAAMDVDRFMTYRAYGKCPDDWILAQKLLVAGCDPLPRRRCFSRSPPGYSKPLPANSSLWSVPSDKNILWNNYKCKSYHCLVSNDTTGRRGFFKCSDCFELSKRGWVRPTNESTSAEFTVDEVLRLKPGEIRIGLDFSPTSGTFAAIMKERNVTIASATLNLGAPFNEVIALRGLLPLYVSVGSRLPFFDNTLDIIHSTLFLDGWIAVELLQYVLLDWDRILRPKGVLWIDRFFCAKDDMKPYLNEFGKLGYKKLLWRIVPKTDKLGEELFFSAVLEKPLRS